ncbi:structure specific recognition protein-like [Acyrthosiphon pisum]|uniref:FACT complex subunit SSRP1 n=1 Tax=Acyrthosiphon pisum TaxID=7029 RepID=A0A8R1TEE2_ACYPI|nr:structure specific recognition protein-like [Acyrthosiphon pisum]|eukprot:NP_001156579.1 structure specific recognition protein-like [Acyrthosiphon pisum]
MDLEFQDVRAEVKGIMCTGRLKFTEQNIVFKNVKTGKVEQLTSSDIEFVNWQKLVGTCGIRIFLKNGNLHRYSGFNESDQDKIAKYFKNTYRLDMLEKELAIKGWNWGSTKFNGSILSFDIGNLTAFEIPLNNVSQCTTGKNEVTLEFHQNDETPVSLCEMRFHIPSAELAGDQDPVDAFHDQVMKQASVISISGDAIAIFREMQCLTPRGRYDIKVFQTFFQLHGKTFDYKIPMTTVLRLFILPHKDGRQIFFVVSLDPPIKQGQTRYHYLVLLFNMEEETSIELPFTDEEIEAKYAGKLTKEISGPTYGVLAQVMKAIVNRKITTPASFKGHSGTSAIGCSYKAAAGYVYPLERGFIYIHKPPIHIRFEEISSVNFARGGGSTRSFDFEIELKNGVIHTFSSIEKEEYGSLYDFINAKKLRVKNTGKSDKPAYTGDDYGDSDKEAEPDAYLARVKREGQERDEDDDDDSDESTDEDFNPEGQESDVAEEFDSNPSTTESESGNEEGGGGDKKKEKKEKKKKDKKPKSAKTISEKPRKSKKSKKPDDGRPKRAATAYMIWFNEAREEIKSDNPGISFVDIAKKGGELWKKMSTSDKSKYEEKAAKSKEEYIEAMKEFKESGGGAESFKDSKESKKSSKKFSSQKKVATPVKSGSFISKEFIESDDDSSSDDKSKNITKFKKKFSDDSSDDKKSPIAIKFKKTKDGFFKSKRERAFFDGTSEEDKSKSMKKRKSDSEDDDVDESSGSASDASDSD